MNTSIALSIFAVIWLFVYTVNQDVVKILAKHMVFFTLMAALFEGGQIYGAIAIYALLGLVVVIWFIMLIFDYIEFTTKPLRSATESIRR